MRKLKVISRKSPLALLQVKEVFEHFPKLDYELIKLDSYGDKHHEISLLENPPADIFTRELDNAILNDKADIAVHSAKDLPYPLPEGLEVIALFDAFDKTDSLISRNNQPLAGLPAGACVGTSSPTRRKELLALRADMAVVSVRGTIEQRIALVDKGEIDALIVATCALKRLGLSHRIAEVLTFETHPLQGHLAIVAAQTRTDLKALFAEQDIRIRYGKVILVGFGPGNPELLTLCGERALTQADIIFHDDLLDKDFLEKYSAKKVWVGKRSGNHGYEQNEINRLLLDAATGGKQVVRLKGGDPMVFAHGGEEIEYLQSHFVEVSVIPGVSSGIAVSSLTKIPLTHRGIASSVAFVTGHSASVQIPPVDTLVYYMGGGNIHTISQKAICKGRNPKTPVMLVYNVSRPDQQEFFSTLGDLASSSEKYPTPVIIVIGEVVSLRKNSEQSVRKPSFLVTGTHPEQYDQIGTVVHQPLISIEPIGHNPELESQLNRLEHYDWLFFTSRYAVKFFFNSLEKLGKDTRSLAGLKIASVGATTSTELQMHGIMPDVQPDDESSEGLLAYFNTNHNLPGKVFIPRSDLGLPVLPEGMRKLGWEVTTVSVYRNVYPDDARPIELSSIDNIVFSSPSGVSNFLRLYGSFPSDKKFIFKGKETQRRFLELSKSIT